MSAISAIDPLTWFKQPSRVLGFLTDLATNFDLLIKLEKYKTKPGLMGVGGLKRQFIPSFVRQIIPTPKQKKSGAAATSYKLPELQGLPKLPKLPKL
jgi:hypothetical protein